MKKHILYLASGSSRRFGENKLLYPFRGKPLFLHGLECLHSYVQKHTDCTLTVVSRYESIRRKAAEMGIAAVDSPESEKGVSYTIKAGIAALSTSPSASLTDVPNPIPNCSDSADRGVPSVLNPSADLLLFVVADQPFLREASIARLFEEYLDCRDNGSHLSHDCEVRACEIHDSEEVRTCEASPVGASLAWGNRPGNPVLFSASLIPELMALEGDKGGRAVLRRHPHIFVQAEAEEELYDIDTLQDLGGF